jgi:hypothetical protein
VRLLELGLGQDGRECDLECRSSGSSRSWSIRIGRDVLVLGHRRRDVDECAKPAHACNSRAHGLAHDRDEFVVHGVVDDVVPP